MTLSLGAETAHGHLAGCLCHVGVPGNNFTVRHIECNHHLFLWPGVTLFLQSDTQVLLVYIYRRMKNIHKLLPVRTIKPFDRLGENVAGRIIHPSTVALAIGYSTYVAVEVDVSPVVCNERVAPLWDGEERHARTCCVRLTARGHRRRGRRETRRAGVGSTVTKVTSRTLRNMTVYSSGREPQTSLLND